ncbi:MAG TPA: hypothetical protein VGW10_14660 [Solirubrobacteraceae bacterium]|nr:hypothetical protein [Solirubrobacteraceae bacterium]
MPGHLIHIGFPKAGSTALAAWFDAHPQMTHAPNGLGGFYSAFALAAYAAGSGPEPLWHVTSGESLSFPRLSDAAPARDPSRPARDRSLTDSRERVCRMLRALTGEATILIVTRGFRTAMLSGYSQYLKGGGRDRATELRPDPAVIAEALDYDAVVALYEEAFGRERVIVLPFELLREDPAAFVGALEARLGLRPGTAPPLEVRNPSLTPAGRVWQRRMTLAAGLVARVLPARLGERLLAGLARLGTEDRLLRPLELLGQIAPGAAEERVEVPDDVLAALRGRAASLHGRRFYDRFAAEYLNDER